MSCEMPRNGGAGGVLGALGLCAKAGKLICGTPLICEALKAKKTIFLVAEASDNSENTKKRLRDRCTFYGVKKVTLECDGEALAGALGKGGRVSAAAITDEQLCRLVTSKLDREHIL